MARNSTQSGFTLIEAMVALVIIGMALVPLLDLFGATTNSVLAAKAGAERARAQLNALEFLDSINPLKTPSGNVAIGPNSIAWEATPVAPPVAGMNYGRAGVSLYQVGLYDVEVRVERPDGRPWFSFSYRRIGFTRSRANALGL